MRSLSVTIFFKLLYMNSNQCLLKQNYIEVKVNDSFKAYLYCFLFHRVWLYKASDGPEFDEQRCEISKDVFLRVSNSQ